MERERFFLTQAGYERLKRELDDLVNVQDKALTAELIDARDDTQFAEEATYFDALAAKARLDERIAHLKTVLEYAEIITEDPDPERVDPGERVTVWDAAARETLQFDLLDSEEVKHTHRGVSVESPVGKALLGHRVGDVVEIEVPDGKVRYVISRIERLE